MTKTIKTLGGAAALVGAALVGGTMISATLAASAPGATTTTPQTAAESATPSGAPATKDTADRYRDMYLDALAEKLGVDRSALGPAALAAANATIDKALANGDLTADQAQALRDRLANLDNPDQLLGGGIFHRRGPGFRPGFGGPRFGPGGPHGFGFRFGFGFGGDGGDAAAKALGIDDAALRTALRDGKSLKDLATERNVDYATVTKAVTDAVKAHLDQEVTDKELTQAQADAKLKSVTDWLAAGGVPGSAPGFGGGGPRI